MNLIYNTVGLASLTKCILYNYINYTNYKEILNPEIIKILLKHLPKCLIKYYQKSYRTYRALANGSHNKLWEVLKKPLL